jgi:hypothetical protein
MAAACAIVFAGSARRTAAVADNGTGVLHEHPSINYAARPAHDRVARWTEAAVASGRPFPRDPRTGYLRGLLKALGISEDSQLLVFSKTGVQRAYTGPHMPRALYFDESVVVGYVPGAPAIEIAAHDPEQGVIFYTLDQNADVPRPARRTSCLTCHVSPGTLNVPGVIARSHFVGDDGNVMPAMAIRDVTHQTPHPDRWGGWLVTSEDTAPPYSQRAHQGNITFTAQGHTSNQVFVEWMSSAPETQGYLSSSSDIGALLAFDHQMHAINLLTRLNWEWRVAASQGDSLAAHAAVRTRVEELADYLLFDGEAPLQATLTARPGFAKSLASRIVKDANGRSFGQLDLVTRLLRYPCSYMVYSQAFDALPPPVRQAIYRRMIETLTGPPDERRFPHLRPEDRRATLDILRATKPDFPGA